MRFLFLLVLAFVSCSNPPSNREKCLTESTRTWDVDRIDSDYSLVRFSIRHNTISKMNDEAIWLITLYANGKNNLVFRGSLNKLKRDRIKIPKADNDKYLVGVKCILLDQAKEYSWSSDQLIKISSLKINTIRLLDNVDDLESVTLVVE